MSTGNLNLKANWGPFSRTYLGISHILNNQQGIMVDIALLAGRNKPASVVLPDNIFDYIQDVKKGKRRATIYAVPEAMATDYSSYSLRYFLDPHGDTALAKFRVENDNQVHCEITFCNNSNNEREYFYGMGLVISDSRKKICLKKSLKTSWIAAKNYSSINAYKKSFALGQRQCLSQSFSWGIEDKLLSDAFGGWPGDNVHYKTSLVKPLKSGFIYFRYVKYGKQTQTWELKINNKIIKFSFPQTLSIHGGGWGKGSDEYEEWRLFRLPIGSVSETDIDIELRSLDDAPGNDQARIWLDGMIISDGLLNGDDGTKNLLSTSLTDEHLCKNNRIEYAGTDKLMSKFKIILDGQAPQSINVVADDVIMESHDGRGSFLNYLRKKFKLPQASANRDLTVPPWGAVDSKTITVPQHSTKTASFKITFGENIIEPSYSRMKKTITRLEGPYSKMISQLMDNILFNVNYPSKFAGIPSHYIVPAKYFPEPFFWDGGLTALGTVYIDSDFALAQVRYYMADENFESPFLGTGSPIPTPLYALWEIFQKKNNLKMLSNNYAGAKRMYDFYLGRTAGSVVNVGNNGLLSTYPYCYNLGIDDHPIQRWAEQQQITEKGLYSIILISQVLRVAKIMRNIAYLLILGDDVKQYEIDIETLQGVIDNQMWDDKSSLYGWLQQTDHGVTPVILDGCAGDRSACSFFPLFAGQTKHKDKLIEIMFDSTRFNTVFGISSVDMSAPSYNPHGYWNGHIWAVMQWYIWRGLLEAGEPKLARNVAETILKTWLESFEKQHYLGEHFGITDKRMNGAPNFGGLSSVLMQMHAAYFSKYQITTLYDVIIHHKLVDKQSDTLTMQISTPFLSAEYHDLLVNMDKGKTQYEFTSNGKLLGKSISDGYGHLSLRLPCFSSVTEIRVKSVSPR